MALILAKILEKQIAIRSLSQINAQEIGSYYVMALYTSK